MGEPKPEPEFPLPKGLNWSALLKREPKLKPQISFEDEAAWKEAVKANDKSTIKRLLEKLSGG